MGNLAQYFKIGFGFEMVRESVSVALKGASHMHALAERFYALQDKITPESMFQFDKTIRQYTNSCPWDDGISTLICATAGSMLLASGIYNLVRKSRSPEE